MTRTKNALARTQKFVSDHRVALTIAATAVITTVVVNKTKDNMYASAKDFIESKGLLDEYYASAEDSEL
jgi:hypothetical protein